jgi:radical SAM protein with 4Fe4S-binding SPASM domain
MKRNEEKMKLPALILMVTEDCNFRCKYCFQVKRKHYMEWETAKQALDFFLPSLKKNYRFIFLGGEPLLAFDLIKKSVAYLEQKNKEQVKSPAYVVVTNGSLLDDNCLDFLRQNNFTIALSFDGYAQNSGRKKNSFAKTVAIIKKILRLKNITLNVNSTFFPGTAAKICKSIEYTMRLGVQHISLSLDLKKRWDRLSLQKLAGEIADLRELVLKNYKKNNTIPVTLFRKKNDTNLIWRCAAGRNQLTVTPGGHIWGCPCFYEYFKKKEGIGEFAKFYFGKLEDFARNHEKKYRRILSHYSRFRMDNYYTANSRCFLCPLVKKCGVCPVIRSTSPHPLLYVHSYICEINKILIAARENFPWKSRKNEGKAVEIHA